MKKILEVPHWTQYYDISEDYWQGRSCGIVSLAMVLDYYNEPQDLDLLVQKGLDLGAYSKEAGGWSDSGLCKLARNLDFLAYRRRWELAKRDREFLESEGATSADLELHQDSLLAEGLYALKRAIDVSEPVIISIHKNWDSSEGGHLAVLNGYFESEGKLEGFYVCDPIGASYKNKDQFIAIDTFISGWKRRAIYVKKS